MDFNAISAWAAVLAVLAAIVALIIQVRQATFNSSLDSLWHLEERFSSTDMRRERARAATFLLERKPDETQEVPEVYDVLDFFDLVGYLVNKHAITKEAAWINFSDGAINYWFASRKYIETQRKKNNSLYWTHYGSLIAVMMDIEAAKQGRRSIKDVTPSEDDWRLFLSLESTPNVADAPNAGASSPRD